MADGPMLARRRLGAELRRLRVAAGRTLEAVAHDTMISTSKLSRLENGQGPPQPRDIRDLISYYEVPTTTAEQFRRWSTQGRERAWWHSYFIDSTVINEQYLNFESAAELISIYAPMVIPDLLQTANYARSMIRATSDRYSDAEVDRLVELRMRRGSEVLESGRSRLIAILDEGVLYRTFGLGSAVAAEQLAHLSEVVSETNIDVRIIPFSAGPHYGSFGGFTIFRFGSDLDLDAVSYESYHDTQYTDDDSSVMDYQQLLNRLAARALDPDSSRRIIEGFIG